MALSRSLSGSPRSKRWLTSLSLDQEQGVDEKEIERDLALSTNVRVFTEGTYIFKEALAP